MYNKAFDIKTKCYTTFTPVHFLSNALHFIECLQRLMTVKMIVNENDSRVVLNN